MATTYYLPSLKHESTRPLIVRFTTWYRENHKAVNDLVILFILSVLTYFLFMQINVTESFYEFTRAHETLQLDDLILTFGAALPIYLAVFAVRRWREAAQLLNQANTDILTGLFNRRKAWDVMGLELARAKRYGRPLSLIMLDIDHFKSVNDSQGHLLGDRVLREVAKTIRVETRSIDTLIRWGGEEFMIISPETTYDEMSQMAERLRKAIERTNLPHNLHITASLGIASFQKDDDINFFFERADRKLYAAKNAGRNRVA